jgi:hypothetical protein
VTFTAALVRVKGGTAEKGGMKADVDHALALDDTAARSCEPCASARSIVRWSPAVA